MISENVTKEHSTKVPKQPDNQSSCDIPAAKRMRVSEEIRVQTSIETEEVLSQGAEAVVSKIQYIGRVAIKKERFAKKYRHPELDAKLTARRLGQEARILLRMRKAGIRVPAVYHVDQKKNVIIQEFCNGQTLKQFLHNGKDKQLKLNVMVEAGKQIARMHKADIVHGDLTTSNIMILINDKEITNKVDRNSLCLIDFGLSSGGGTEEDLAVDLYVFERAVISAHSESAKPLNKAFFQAYEEELNRPAVMKRLGEVRARGRKRDMTG